MKFYCGRKKLKTLAGLQITEVKQYLRCSSDLTFGAALSLP